MIEDTSGAVGRSRRESDRSSRSFCCFCRRREGGGGGGEVRRLCCSFCFSCRRREARVGRRWRCRVKWLLPIVLLMGLLYIAMDVFIFETLHTFPVWAQEWKGKYLSVPGPPRLIVTFGSMGTHHSVKEYGAGASGKTGSNWVNPNLTSRSTTVTPYPWDSTLCMKNWEAENLQTEVDTNGYLIFVMANEQLGGNKFMLTDGLFIAEAMNRTLVEYPVKNARIAEANCTLGVGAYWDLSALCMKHRILDISSFRSLVERGKISPEDFVTIETHSDGSFTRRFETKTLAAKKLKEFAAFKVIVLDHTWKSGIVRNSMDFLRPNPFYVGVVKMLTNGHEDFTEDNFIAVQWRTETATGDMNICYGEVRELIEEHRNRLGFSRDQVLLTTDMVGTASGTYSASKQKKMGERVIAQVRKDYPKALENRLHDFFNQIEDTGIKAIVSGLVVAQAKVLLASSLNEPGARLSPEAGVCSKPYSGYIHLISDWRTKIMRKDPESLVQLFPFEKSAD